MNTKTVFIQSDEFEGVDLQENRSTVAFRYLHGKGVEIGALHNPLQVDEDKCFVRYIDYKTRNENRARYPELDPEGIVNTDIVDDGFTLIKVRDNSQDFIISNHALEHSPDPYGTLLKWLSKLKKGGRIYVTVPVGEKCYDKGRPVTTIEHYLDDHKLFKDLKKEEIVAATRQHIEEFIEISDSNIRIQNNMKPAEQKDKERLANDLINSLKEAMSTASSYDQLITAHIHKINRAYDIHYHVFSPKMYERFLNRICEDTGSELESLSKNSNIECIAIIRKN